MSATAPTADTEGNDLAEQSRCSPRIRIDLQTRLHITSRLPAVATTSWRAASRPLSWHGWPHRLRWVVANVVPSTPVSLERGRPPGRVLVVDEAQPGPEESSMASLFGAFR